ncbi:pectin acetylesterase 5-like [Telopea speciosissima]|uniref:pectin acetylesterase 5-like n=1 Tax=Telopea speciosissima TaxID=54955 RepID=UPI001CC347D8|nr:pectin acetylesterase 5-like [Telopea speciosissima]
MANPRLRGLTWLRQKWGRKDWAIAATGFTLLMLAIIVTLETWTQETESSVNQYFNPDPPLVDLTLLSNNAMEKGAVCLDGSPPGYHFLKGFGSGANNWLLHLEGGGWCDTVASCSMRKRTALGSSKYMNRQVPFSGILSNDPSQNPEFFNWNKVKIRYCDGASFSGNPESEFKNGTELFFRGQLIWKEIMGELLSIGLAHVSQAVLSGCSSGGLATLIHCDDFRELLPKDAIVKCVADAGFFLDVKDISGNSAIQSFYRNVVDLQGVVQSLNKDCISRMEPSQCFFPQEIIKNTKTPVFLVHPAYDIWQIQNILVPGVSDPHHEWLKCRLNIYNCNRRQIKVLQEFRSSLLKALEEFRQKKNGGMFINSCFVHCQTWMTSTWHSPGSPRINNKTIAESVGDWYFNRRVVTEIDCAYPCNPTCFNMILVGPMGQRT